MLTLAARLSVVFNYGQLCPETFVSMQKVAYKNSKNDIYNKGI